MGIGFNDEIPDNSSSGILQRWAGEDMESAEPGPEAAKIANAINWWKRLSIPSGIKILKWSHLGFRDVRSRTTSSNVEQYARQWFKIAKRPWPGWKRTLPPEALHRLFPTPDNLSRQNRSISRSRRSSQCGDSTMIMDLEMRRYGLCRSDRLPGLASVAYVAL